MVLSRRILRYFSTQVRYMALGKPKNHYDSLGVSPKSTQGEIKTAYYKLSMIYHPDKNKDEASHAKFRDIKEAYEVLGNVSTRKLYDRGMYFRSGVTAQTDKTVDKFHKSRETRSRPPPPTGRTPIYDFDEWSRSHYEETFQRKMENKKRGESYRNERQAEMTNKKMETVVFFVLTFFLICMVCSKEKDYDTFNFGSHGIFIAPKGPDDPKD